jgi:hypothetical protein
VSGPRDRDRITGELAALGEPPATVDERSDAVSMARLVDHMLDGQAAPPAMDAEERALLEAATQVHASLGEAGLPPARAKALLDGVFPRSTNGPSVPFMPAPGRRPTTVPPRAASVTSLLPPARAKVKLGRTLPWAVAVLCAAAALLLWLKVPGAPAAPAAHLRSPDAVVGAPIAREHAADASARLDALVADRRAVVAGGKSGRGGGVR